MSDSPRPRTWTPSNKPNWTDQVRAGALVVSTILLIIIASATVKIGRSIGEQSYPLPELRFTLPETIEVSRRFPDNLSMSEVFEVNLEASGYSTQVLAVEAIEVETITFFGSELYSFVLNSDPLEMEWEENLSLSPAEDFQLSQSIDLSFSLTALIDNQTAFRNALPLDLAYLLLRVDWTEVETGRAHSSTSTVTKIQIVE